MQRFSIVFFENFFLATNFEGHLVLLSSHDVHITLIVAFYLVFNWINFCLVRCFHGVSFGSLCV